MKSTNNKSKNRQVGLRQNNKKSFCTAKKRHSEKTTGTRLKFWTNPFYNTYHFLYNFESLPTFQWLQDKLEAAVIS